MLWRQVTMILYLYFLHFTAKLDARRSNFFFYQIVPIKLQN